MTFSDEMKKKKLTAFKDLVNDQESIEYDLFKDVTLPDMKEKEPKKTAKEKAEDERNGVD